MADLKRVKAEIKEIADGNRKNVALEDISRLIGQLELNKFEASVRKTKHEILFRVSSPPGVGPRKTQRFGVCPHNPGSKHVKRCYVDVFIKAMIELGLYED